MNSNQQLVPRDDVKKAADVGGRLPSREDTSEPARRSSSAGHSSCSVESSEITAVKFILQVGGGRRCRCMSAVRSLQSFGAHKLLETFGWTSWCTTVQNQRLMVAPAGRRGSRIRLPLSVRTPKKLAMSWVLHWGRGGEDERFPISLDFFGHTWSNLVQ